MALDRPGLPMRCRLSLQIAEHDTNAGAAGNELDLTDADLETVA
jgi:hypothetical protein